MTDLYTYTPEDGLIYAECVKGLPGLGGFSGKGRGSDGEPIPSGLGPHSVRCIREVCEIAQPESILEIGFNLGYSASLWLHFSNAILVSIDIRNSEEIKSAAHLLRERHPERFRFKVCNGGDAGKQFAKGFDLAFIDGDHSLDGVTDDIKSCLELGIEKLCFDDWLPIYGDVQKAVEMFPQIKVVKVLGNIAYCEVQP